MTIFKFELGDRARDTITKFEGIIVTRSEWLNGCIRYNLQPTKLKDGLPQDMAVIDEDQLTLVKAKESRSIIKRTGGPRRDSHSPTGVKL